MTGQLELDLGAQSNESNKYKKVSDLDMYQKVALTTAIYPREQAIIYPTHFASPPACPPGVFFRQKRRPPTK